MGTADVTAGAKVGGTEQRWVEGIVDRCDRAWVGHEGYGGCGWTVECAGEPGPETGRTVL